MRPTSVLAALVTAAVLTACGSGGSAAPPTSTSSADGFGSSCQQGGDREFTLPGPDGGSVFAVMVGKGKRAIVLIHQASSDHCQWMGTARELAKSGVQVWAMDSSGGSGRTRPKQGGPSTALDLEVDPVVAAARQHGADEIVLAGASMGGTLAIAAAGRTHAVRVASLSGPGSYGGADALGAISTLKIPVLLVASEEDSDFALSARQLAAAGPKGLVTHLEIGGTAHGVAALSGSYQGKSIDDTFTQFVLAH